MKTDNIKIGDSGSKVKRWQTFLTKNGFIIKTDGNFGPLTDNATKQYQLSRGLTADGIISPSMLKGEINNQKSLLTSSWPAQDYNSMVNYYGPVGENQTSLVLPYKLKLAWDKNTSLNKITCHSKVAQSLYAIFEKTLKTYGPKDVELLKLNIFGGCLNVRKMRGGSSWSIHSWGAAIDLDPDYNQLKWGRDRAEFARTEYEEFWNIVENEGWTSLGRKKNYDWMHFQAANI